MLSFANPVQILAADSDEIVSNHIDGLIDFEENHEEADKWGENKYKEWQESLTSKEINAIQQYTLSSKGINSYLRSTEGELKNNMFTTREDKIIKTIDGVLKKTKTSEPMMVYRRVTEVALGAYFEDVSLYDEEDGNEINRNAFSEISKKIKGKIKTTYGYLSSSLSKDPSAEYSKLPILMKIKLPEGTHAAYLGVLSEAPEENEMLVARGFTYKIEDTSIVTVNGREYMEIEVRGLRK